MKTKLLRFLPPVTLRQARRIVIGVLGGTVILCGFVMVVTPGPGLLVIFAGLSILAAEFVWARRLLKRVRQEAKRSAELFLDRVRNQIALHVAKGKTSLIKRWRSIWLRGVDYGRRVDRCLGAKRCEPAAASLRT
jgi:uncharacterized protein (TIGR02611 family)